MVTMMKVRQAFRPVLVLTVIGAAACVDSGLPGKNLPLEDARIRPPAYNTYDASLNIAPVTFDGRDWMAAGPAAPLSVSLLQLVVTGEREVFALATDAPPYSRLYVRTAAGFAPLAPAPIAGTAQPVAPDEHR